MKVPHYHIARLEKRRLDKENLMKNRDPRNLGCRDICCEQEVFACAPRKKPERLIVRILKALLRAVE